MKVINDGQGQFIIDFEGLEIDMSDAKTLGAPGALFDLNVVSEVRNGVWIFDKESKNGRRRNS